eukprot:s1060_g1.t1
MPLNQAQIQNANQRTFECKLENQTPCFFQFALQNTSATLIVDHSATQESARLASRQTPSLANFVFEMRRRFPKCREDRVFRERFKDPGFSGLFLWQF